MSSTSAVRAPQKRSNAKLWSFLGFAFLTIFVVYGKNKGVFTPGDPMREHFQPGLSVLIPHAIFATVAMILGAFQFSTRIRAKYAAYHRAAGYVYAACVYLGAPLGVAVALNIGPPELIMASVVQTLGWIACMTVALYCIRNGDVTQHRRWMIRSYPFAMVFTVARVFVPIAQKFYGQPGFIQAVWSTIALAAIIPIFILDWPKIRKTVNA